MRIDKRSPQKSDKKAQSRAHKRGVVGYSKKSALLEEAITHMNTGKYGRSSAALKELLSLDPHNTEARRLFATLHLRLGSLVTARQAFESLATEAIGRQDFWLAESMLREYLAAGPRCVPFLELLAHVYEEKGDAMAAVAELGKAIDILIESSDPENPKKPSQLYAKVRELAPASAVAFQFASLFDIQTGELLLPHPPAPAAPPAMEVAASEPQSETLTGIEESKASEVMPWEQFDETLPSQELPPSASSDSIGESHDVPEALLSDSAPDGLASQPQTIPPSDSIGFIQEPNQLDDNPLDFILDESPVPSSENRNEGMADSIAERTAFADGEPPPHSSEESTADIERPITSSVEPSVLPSPMPWEQIENSTIRIEEAAPSPPLSSQPERASPVGDESVLSPSVQPEPVSEQLPSSDPAPNLTEPSESILAVEPPSVNPTIHFEPKVPTESIADPSPTAPFSWNNVLDGTWKFAAGTLSSSALAKFSKAGTNLPDSSETESVQPETAPEHESSAPFLASTLEPPLSLQDPEPMPAPTALVLSEVIDSIAEPDAIRESEQPQLTVPIISEVPSRAEEPSTKSSDSPSLFKEDVSAPPQSESVESTREPQSVPSFTEPKAVEPFARVSVPEPAFSTVVSESPPVSEPISTESHEISNTSFQAATAPPVIPAPTDTPSASTTSTDAPSYWSTGEVEVQPHRPSKKKRNWDKNKGEASVVPPELLPPADEFPQVVDELSHRGGWESAPTETVAPVVAAAAAPIVEKVVPPEEDTRPEWVRTSESITFVNPTLSSTAWQDSPIESVRSTSEPGHSVVASAVDVLFDSTGEKNQGSTQDRLASPRPRPRFAAKVARVRIGISSFIGSCFSTTRSIVLLCVGLLFSCIMLAVIGIGVVAIAWMVMEAPPSPVYHNLTASPPRTLIDPTKNGYFLLLGMDVSSEQDPLQAGYERKVEESDVQAANACMLGDNGDETTAGVFAGVRGWFTSADPVAQLKLQAASIRSWAAQESLVLKRYQQWLPMSFEDTGYGQIQSPNCARILLAHRLYLAEGFEQDLSTGLGRLESDMKSWRTVLAQSKTLMVKMLAATAVQDDAAIASGLLTHQDLDQTAIGRLSKIVRPLDPVESSLRWPMQSHLVWATQAVTKRLRHDKSDKRPLYVALTAAMPLPVQRRANAYADYYEAASKAVAEGRYTNLPKLSAFIRTPAVSVLDYVANPIEHIVGIEPLPSWDPYVGRTIETDARLRLASLQAWIRQGAQDGNVVTRLAKAGQAHYDPFTGLPMLVDQQKGLMYSVGQDGKDQEGDPQRDIVATIPKSQSAGVESSRSVTSSRSK